MHFPEQIMKERIDYYPFNEKYSRFVEIDSKCTFHSQMDPENFSYLLYLDYRPIPFWQDFGKSCVRLCGDGKYHNSQYFVNSDCGKRYINVSDIEGSVISAEPHHCIIGDRAKLYAFARVRNPGRTLIVAPHPDDAELGAFTFLSSNPANTFVVTLSAGEAVKDMDRQYFSGMDQDLSAAIRRKGTLRAWNAATVPLLCGIESDHLYMLGYPDGKLTEMMMKPSTDIKNPADPELRPSFFRLYNRDLLAHGEESRWDHLVDELADLMSSLAIQTVVVTNPIVDSHPDHIAAAYAVADAIRKNSFTPENVFMYVNHIRKAKRFNTGPVGCVVGPQVFNAKQVFGTVMNFESRPLDGELLKKKGIAMNAMYDLYRPDGFFATVRHMFKKPQWFDSPRIGLGRYFMRSLKANEPFCVVSGHQFLKLCDESRNMDRSEDGKQS